jgi:hypothetical protein
MTSGCIKAIIALLALLAGTSASAQYSLEESLGAPYVQSIHASADKQSIAWVVNERGVRNIWHAELNGNSQQLTDYREDDGLNIANVTVSSGFVLFVRGNGNNRSGQPANPASLPVTPNAKSSG